MMIDIGGPIRNQYEVATGEPFDEWKEHIKQEKVPTWDYICWLENELYKYQMQEIKNDEKIL